jgi:hypothetical protein
MHPQHDRPAAADNYDDHDDKTARPRSVGRVHCFGADCAAG